MLIWLYCDTDMNDDGVICSDDFNSVLDSLTAGQMPQQTKDVLIKYVMVNMFRSKLLQTQASNYS